MPATTTTMSARHLSPVLVQDTFWSPSRKCSVDSTTTEDDESMLATPEQGQSPAFSFSPYFASHDDEDDVEMDIEGHAFDHGSAVAQKRRSTYLPAVLTPSAAVPNYARPIRSNLVNGGVFGASAQRSRRQTRASAPSPCVMPSPTFSTSTYDDDEESLPVTPPAPNATSNIASPTIGGRRSKNLMSKTLYSLKNASTASFAAVGGPLRGLGMPLDADEDDVDSPSSPLGRGRKSSLTRPFSTLFGIKRKKVPSMEARSVVRPDSVQSHTVVVATQQADDEDEEMLVDSSDDEFSSYARTVYELEAGSRSVDTLRAGPASPSLPTVEMPAITLEELAHVRASLDAMYRTARGPSPVASSSKASSIRSIRRKPVPALINASPVIPPRSASFEQGHQLEMPSRVIVRRNPPPALRARPSSASSGSELSDSAPTLTPTLNSAKTSSSSGSSSSSLDSFPFTPSSDMLADGKHYELDVASILDPEDEASRPLSGIGLEQLVAASVATVAGKKSSWAGRLMRQKSRRNVGPVVVL